MKQFTRILSAILAMICSSILLASNKPKSVNVLTWWGYLDDPKISALVKEKCGANISFDEYYSNDEFFNRFEENPNQYDIIIFSQIMYGVIGKQIASNNSILNTLSGGYVNFIKTHYKNNQFPNNVAYFTMSVMGFLWNPVNIELSPNDNVIDAFKKGGSNDVVLIDDPMEVNNVMKLAFNDKSNLPILSVENMRKMTQDTNVYITDDYSKIYDSKNFAFSYLWSGDAFYDMQKQNYKYKFLVNQKSSYICPDLIAQLKDNTTTACVAKVLGSRQVLNIVQNSDYYFSPYGDSSEINDKEFQSFYTSLFNMMPNMRWIKPVSLDHFEQMTKTWKVIKLSKNSGKN